MSLTSKQQWVLQQIGVQLWKPREVKKESHSEAKDNKIDRLSWNDLKHRVSNCQLCALHQSRTQTVFGVGNQQADLLIIGEAPGANEDLQGEPFVGRAGKLLDAMLRAIHLDREKVYIANILKCRPPQNRDPKPEEVTSCTPFLLQQIQKLQPKLILAVGRIAAQYLLQTTLSMGKLRLQLHHYGENKIPLLVTYHPAYLLRSPLEKRKALEDLWEVKRLLDHNNPA